MTKELEIVSQNIMKIDAELLSAYKEYINHLHTVKDYYVGLQHKFEQEDALKDIFDNEGATAKENKKK